MMRSIILGAALVAAPLLLRAQAAPERRAAGPLRGTVEDKIARATAKPGTPAPKPAAGTVVVAPPPHPTTTSTSGSESRDALARRAYAAGTKTNPRVQPADVSGWETIARMTGLDYEGLVTAYDAIYVVDFAQKYLLKHPVTGADSARVVGLVQRLRGGERWQSVWRDVAESPEVERVAGAWAPAPFDSPEQARDRFGLRASPTPEQCVGAVGDMCDGGVPALFPSVQPRWSNYFTLPDGTRMGFVEVGVNVGSILFHDSCAGMPLDTGCASYQSLASQVAHAPTNDRLLNMLTFAQTALAVLAIDPKTLGSQPVDRQSVLASRAAAWNKAMWNVADRRGWRETFGPYPVDVAARRKGWYDDLRPAPAREAWMAPVPSVGLPGPDQSLAFYGSETRATTRLAAPSGAQLDGRDGAYCRSHTFKSVTTPFLKAPLGVCQ